MIRRTSNLDAFPIYLSEVQLFDPSGYMLNASSLELSMTAAVWGMLGVNNCFDGVLEATANESRVDHVSPPPQFAACVARDITRTPPLAGNLTSFCRSKSELQAFLKIGYPCSAGRTALSKVVVHSP